VTWFTSSETIIPLLLFFIIFFIYVTVWHQCKLNTPYALKSHAGICVSSLSSWLFLLQVIFSEIFRLPNPPHIELFYGSLLIELCKSQPNSMPGIVSFTIKSLH
jgi:hypothetical protein